MHCISLLIGSTPRPLATLTPPSEVLSNNTAVSGSTRYNLNTGAAFNISCKFTHTSDAFTVSFYKDGVVIRDGDLVDTTLTETVFSVNQRSYQLQFLNFQPVHDGVYHCLVSTSDTNEEGSSDLYLYGSGEDCMHVWSEQVHCMGQCITCIVHYVVISQMECTCVEQAAEGECWILSHPGKVLIYCSLFLQSSHLLILSESAQGTLYWTPVLIWCWRQGSEGTSASTIGFTARTIHTSGVSLLSLKMLQKPTLDRPSPSLLGQLSLEQLTLDQDFNQHLILASS